MKVLGRTNNNKSVLPKDEITELLPTKTSQLTNDSNFITTIPSEYITEDELTTELNNKQDKLVSSTNIKTINGESILGSGNIETGGAVVDLGTFSNETELITHVIMNQLPTGHYTFIMRGAPAFVLLFKGSNFYKGTFHDSVAIFYYFEVSIYGEIQALIPMDLRILMDVVNAADLADYAPITYVDDQDALKADKTYVDSQDLKQMPISGGVLENYREKLVALSGTSVAINLSLGNVFTHSLTGNTTYTISNAVSGQAHSFTLIINMGSTVRTLTFPASVKWQGGEIPDLSTASKTYVLTFMTIDGGTNWLGMFGGEF